MNVFLLSAAGMFTLCSAFSVTERSCRPLSVRPPSAGSLETIQQQQQQCLSYSHPQQHHRLQSTLSPNEELAPGISVIDAANEAIVESMGNLQHSPYFRLFCVDILASCEYMPQELFECYSETCEVYPVDDEEVCLYECSE